MNPDDLWQRDDESFVGEQYLARARFGGISARAFAIVAWPKVGTT